MRLTLQLLGLELDVTFGPVGSDEVVEADPRGDTLSTPLGFTRSACPEWEVPGSYHQFDPEPDSEDRR